MVSLFASYLGKKLTKLSADSNRLRGYNREQYEAILVYQMTVFLKTIIGIVLLIISTWIIGCLIEDDNYYYTTFIVSVTLFSFKKLFGGYHNDNEVVCILISIVVLLAISYLALKQNFNIYIIVLIYVFSYVTAFRKGVVDSPQKRFKKGNKILTLELKERFLRIGLLLLVITTIVHIFLFFQGDTLASNSIALALFLAFFNLYFGK